MGRRRPPRAGGRAGSRTSASCASTRSSPRRRRWRPCSGAGTRSPRRDVLSGDEQRAGREQLRWSEVAAAAAAAAALPESASPASARAHETGGERRRNAGPDGTAARDADPGLRDGVALERAERFAGSSGTTTSEAEIKSPAGTAPRSTMTISSAKSRSGPAPTPTNRSDSARNSGGVRKNGPHDSHAANATTDSGRRKGHLRDPVPRSYRGLPRRRSRPSHSRFARTRLTSTVPLEPTFTSS